MNRLINFLNTKNTLFVSGLIGLAISAVVLVLVLPALMQPPAELGPDYDIFDERMAGSTIEPEQNSLIELPGSGVSVFIPANSFQDRGQLLVKERRVDLVPFRTTEGFLRELAVDLLFVNREGNVQVSYPLNEKLLLCFELDDTKVSLPDKYTVQVYDEALNPPEWVGLEQAPGWQPDQVCGLVEHLSLFALTRSTIRDEGDQNKSVPSPSPSDTATPLELYVPPNSNQ